MAWKLSLNANLCASSPCCQQNSEVIAFHVGLSKVESDKRHAPVVLLVLERDIHAGNLQDAFRIVPPLIEFDKHSKQLPLKAQECSCWTC